MTITERHIITSRIPVLLPGGVFWQTLKLELTCNWDIWQCRTLHWIHQFYHTLQMQFYSVQSNRLVYVVTEMMKFTFLTTLHRMIGTLLHLSAFLHTKFSLLSNILLRAQKMLALQNGMLKVISNLIREHFQQCIRKKSTLCINCWWNNFAWSRNYLCLS